MNSAMVRRGCRSPSAPTIAPQCARRNVCHDVGRSGTGGTPVRLQDPRDRRAADPMADILQRTNDPSVAPRGVVLGHQHDQTPDLREHARTAATPLRVRPLPRDQLPMPPENRVGRDDRGDLTETTATQSVSGGPWRAGARRTSRRRRPQGRSSPRRTDQASPSFTRNRCTSSCNSCRSSGDDDSLNKSSCRTCLTMHRATSCENASTSSSCAPRGKMQHA